jgi:dihydroorotate dehydrogenase electron transfer subunit
MTSPLAAQYFADRALCETVEIVENVRLAQDTYRLRFRSPAMARHAVPGQFFMLRLHGLNDPLIGRPLALYDTILSHDGEPEAIDVVYLVKGKLTKSLQHLVPGQKIDVWGPLGNGFMASNSLASTHHSLSHLVLVAGGIGQTPFLALAQEALGRKKFGEQPRLEMRANRVSLCYGARSAGYYAGLDDFERLGLDVRLATDDGSHGHHGLVTDLLDHLLQEERSLSSDRSLHIITCGPEPMMEAVARIALAANVPCQISLETPMACGIGICFSCVAKIRQADGNWDYKRTCVEGPVFEASEVVW